MTERSGVITMKGQPLTLMGPELKVGATAPDFEVTDNDMAPFRFSSLKGQVCLIASVPSLDTPVCDLETRRFNDDAANLSKDIKLLTISMDLPFAQKRWCGAAGVERLQTYSDHLQASFGLAYGVLIKELRLLARAVFVVDKAGTLQYVEVVPELVNQPDYEAILKVVKKLAD